jgi:hypothetical protein
MVLKIISKLVDINLPCNPGLHFPFGEKILNSGWSPRSDPGCLSQGLMLKVTEEKMGGG